MSTTPTISSAASSSSNSVSSSSSFSSSSSTATSSSSPLYQLPPEVLGKILSCLQHSDQRNLASTSRTMHREVPEAANSHEFISLFNELVSIQKFIPLVIHNLDNTSQGQKDSLVEILRDIKSRDFDRLSDLKSFASRVQYQVDYLILSLDVNTLNNLGRAMPSYQNYFRSAVIEKSERKIR